MRSLSLQGKEGVQNMFSPNIALCRIQRKGFAVYETGGFDIGCEVGERAVEKFKKGLILRKYPT